MDLGLCFALPFLTGSSPLPFVRAPPSRSSPLPFLAVPLSPFSQLPSLAAPLSTFSQLSLSPFYQLSLSAPSLVCMSLVLITCTHPLCPSHTVLLPLYANSHNGSLTGTDAAGVMAPEKCPCVWHTTGTSAVSLCHPSLCLAQQMVQTGQLAE
ncbi:hypothetical protein FKM82_012063 [Ascaphus truei]